ncbi:hypothetical protein Syun_017993 [Stephania yunnanensis]|uniref:F-box domain-containing protein n=1 Tax=Stephania yunnanensis TaxID=152371 RepID=A0AAP0ITP6_9MAGN
MAATTTTITTTTSGSKKKKKKVGLDSSWSWSSSELIPGLPEHLAEECLSRVHPRLLYKVCHSWRRLIYSPTFPPFLSLYALLDSSSSSSVLFSTYDPISSTWIPPSPSPSRHPLLLRHPSFIARLLPVQSLSPSNLHLLLLAATSPRFLPALPRPLLFSPPPPPPIGSSALPSPLPAAGAPPAPSTTPSTSPPASPPPSTTSSPAPPPAGLFPTFPTSKENRMRMMKRNIVGGRWEEVAGMRDAAFSREAVEAVGWRGKLCMVNVKGNALKAGVVYDERKGAWEEMREGMLRGWMGPVAAMDEEEMYVVDEGRG